MDAESAGRLIYELIAAERKTAGEPPVEFSFTSPAHLCAATPEVPPWLWRGYIAQGALTIFAGREKTGKSTVLFALLLRGEPFLGQPTVSTGAVYLSEEPAITVVEKLRRFGLAQEEERLSFLTRLPARPGLKRLIPAAVAEAERIRAGLIVVDTLTWWAALPPEAENDAGAMQHALTPLLEATALGFGVLAVHHADKARRTAREHGARSGRGHHHDPPSRRAPHSPPPGRPGALPGHAWEPAV